MPRPSPNALRWLDSWLAAVDARWPGARRRAGAIALMAAIEIALLLALLSLGAGQGGEGAPQEVLTTFDAREDQAPSPEPEPQPQQPSAPAPTAPAQVQRPQPLVVPQPDALPPPPVILQTPNTQTPPPAPPPASPAAPAKPRITAVIRSDMAGAAGPVDRGVPGDSERIAGASGPNGEPLYRARWYREPYPQELRGYLSTAQGPGWALINCQTVPDFKVDHCVLVDEYPAGSNMGRAVLAAAWQFLVRPPRVGGQSQVGAWVRIRIDYTITPR